MAGDEGAYDGNALCSKSRGGGGGGLGGGGGGGRREGGGGEGGSRRRRIILLSVKKGSGVEADPADAEDFPLTVRWPLLSSAGLACADETEIPRRFFV